MTTFTAVPIPGNTRSPLYLNHSRRLVSHRRSDSQVHGQGRRVPCHVRLRTIRDAGPEDAAALLEPVGRHRRTRDNSRPRAVEDAERALATIAADPDERLLVAEAEGAHRRRDQAHPRADLAAGRSTRPCTPPSCWCCPQFRRHGYGHALMEAAARPGPRRRTSTRSPRSPTATATPTGSSPGSGSPPSATVRHSSTAALRKKLSAERGRGAGSNRHLVEVLAQRRSMRRRQDAA